MRVFFVFLSIRCPCCLRTAFLRLHSDGKSVALKGALSNPAQVIPPAGKVPAPGEVPGPALPAIHASPLVEQTRFRLRDPGGSGEQAGNAGLPAGRRNHKRHGRASEGNDAAGHSTRPSPPLTPAAGCDVTPSVRAQRASAGSPTHTRMLKR